MFWWHLLQQTTNAHQRCRTLNHGNSIGEYKAKVILCDMWKFSEDHSGMRLPNGRCTAIGSALRIHPLCHLHHPHERAIKRGNTECPSTTTNPQPTSLMLATKITSKALTTPKRSIPR